MISVDTNVLVRIFVDDQSDRTQIDKARQAVSHHGRVYVSQIVLVETVWVLKSLYGFAKEQIAEVLEHLLDNQAFALENETISKKCVALFARFFATCKIRFPPFEKGG